jgi:hypothetical protein
LRPLTTKLPKDRLFAALRQLVPALLPVSRAAAMVPVVGSQLKRVIPVANYYGELPLDDRQQQEWALLDTFDWLSPAFDNPQTPETVTDWLTRAGMQDIAVLKAGHLVGRGTKPAAGANPT